MRFTMMLIDSPFIHQLGRTLLHSLWEELAIGVLLWFVLLLRKSDARAPYAAGCVALGMMLVVPAATFFVLTPPSSAPTIAVASQPQVSAPPTAPPQLVAIDRYSDAPRASVSQAAPSVIDPVEGSTSHSIPIVQSPTVHVPAPVHIEKTWRQRLPDWSVVAAPWLALIWAAGVIIMSLWNSIAWTAVQRLKRSRISAVSHDVEQAVARLCRRLNLTHVVGVARSALIDSPLVIGAIKPLILLPASVLTDIPVAQLEALLAHELAHIRRHDYLVNLLQTLIETLLFFHPAVWWVSARIRAERENCCDDLALSVTRDRVEYVTALARIAGAHGPAVALAASGGELLPRLRRLIGKSDTDVVGGPRWLAGLFLILVVGACVVVFTTAQKVTAQSAAGKTPATQPASSDSDEKITVTVIDQETGLPLAGASIRSNINGEHPPLVTTDNTGNGTVLLGTNAPKYLSITARKEGYVSTMAFWEKEGRIPNTFTIPLERPLAIGGSVVDEKGSPIANAKVSLSIDKGDNDAGKPFVQIRDVSVSTDAQGKWIFDTAPRGLFKIATRLTHPDFISDTVWQGRSGQIVEQMRSKTAVLVMKKGVRVAGKVVDERGKPISDAAVLIGMPWFAMEPAYTKTDAEGKFILPPLEKGLHAPVIVTAKDHAPSFTDLTIDKDITELSVTLTPPHPMTIQVVDEHGKPMSDSQISFEQWHRAYGIIWEAKTDSDGKATWTEAPADGGTFYIGHPGRIQLQEHLLHGGPDLQTVTLLPEVKITGTVVDDETGKPIENFKIIPGFSSPASRIVWEESGNREIKLGSNGKFQRVESYPRDGYAIRIDANGYLPAESKIYHMEDGALTLEFRLKKATNLIGTLVTPDGTPLAGADIIVATPATQIYIENGAIGSNTFAVQTISDKDGHFKVSPQTGKYLLLVVHEKGYAQLSPEQLAHGDRFIVQPWGKVQGQGLIGTKPAAGRTIIADSRIGSDGAVDKPDSDFIRVHIDDRIVANERGEFSLKHVLPGLATVAIVTEDHRSWTQRQKIEVHAGKQVVAVLGGRGRPVTGQLVIPPSLTGKIDWNWSMSSIDSRPLLPGPVHPPEWETMSPQDRQNWSRAWNQTPEGIAYNRQLQQSTIYPLTIKPDGTFRVDDLVTGNYVLSISVQSAPDKSATTKFSGHAGLKFAIPPIPGGRSSEPVDLGPIGLTTRLEPDVGQPAPALETKTVDGKPLTLADFHGKYVLVDFWATWCKPCVEEIPALKAAYDAFGNDPRFAMISLSLDENAASPRDFAAKEGLKWTQGFLGSWSATEIPNQWGVHGIPSIFLIGPDGKILAIGLRGGAIKSRVAEALKQE